MADTPLGTPRKESDRKRLCEGGQDGGSAATLSKKAKIDELAKKRKAKDASNLKWQRQDPAMAVSQQNRLLSGKTASKAMIKESSSDEEPTIATRGTVVQTPARTTTSTTTPSITTPSTTTPSTAAATGGSSSSGPARGGGGGSTAQSYTRAQMTVHLTNVIHKAALRKDETLTRTKCRESLKEMFGDRVEANRAFVNEEVDRIVDSMRGVRWAAPATVVATPTAVVATATAVVATPTAIRGTVVQATAPATAVATPTATPTAIRGTVVQATAPATAVATPTATVIGLSQPPTTADLLCNANMTESDSEESTGSSSTRYSSNSITTGDANARKREQRRMNCKEAALRSRTKKKEELHVLQVRNNQLETENAFYKASANNLASTRADLTSSRARHDAAAQEIYRCAKITEHEVAKLLNKVNAAENEIGRLLAQLAASEQRGAITKTLLAASVETGQAIRRAAGLLADKMAVDVMQMPVSGDAQKMSGGADGGSIRKSDQCTMAINGGRKGLAVAAAARVVQTLSA
ncbi:hypothetical protein T484DRAFT_1754799 [Baffinella frigidus]|nr:hypothetical protein T484DRAFT_1754799 [Cryptophyta sp. CCMP2293]